MIQEYVWTLRRSGACMGLIVIVIAAAYYRDPQVVQQNMLTVQYNMLSIVSKRLDTMSAQMARKLIKFKTHFCTLLYEPK